MQLVCHDNWLMLSYNNLLILFLGIRAIEKSRLERSLGSRYTPSSIYNDDDDSELKGAILLRGV